MIEVADGRRPAARGKDAAAAGFSVAPHHVLIVGGGFGGLRAARALRRAPVEVILLDRVNHHVFQPLLYQVAAAGLAVPDITAPLRHVLRRQRNATVLLGNVTHIDLAARRVTAGDLVLAYDTLVLATGSQPTWFGHDAWRAHAPALKTVDDALALRRRILGAFEAAERETDPERRAAWLRFVIVGGGPTGVELAGTLSEIARHTLPREFRRVRTREAEIHLVEAGPRLLPALPARLAAIAQRCLARLGVRVALGAAVEAVDAAGVQVGAARIPARTVLWAAGVRAAPPAPLPDLARDRHGRIVVGPDLSVPGHPEVFVIGDLAHTARGAALVPGVAPAAKQMGRHVARVLRARRAGRPAPAFRYRDWGTLASIDRASAVVALGRLQLSGRAGWLFWLFAHILFLIGFRNRVAVLASWAWSWATWGRKARIMLGGGDGAAADAQSAGGAPPTRAWR